MRLAQQTFPEFRIAGFRVEPDVEERFGECTVGNNVLKLFAHVEPSLASRQIDTGNFHAWLDVDKRLTHLLPPGFQLLGRDRLAGNALDFIDAGVDQILPVNVAVVGQFKRMGELTVKGVAGLRSLAV